MSSPTLLLHNHPVSSYAQKIRIALREKSIPFTAETPNWLTLENAEAKRQQFVNPRLEVPALFDGDVAIFDSTVILEYIEDKWPTPPLLPPAASDPAARANARQIEEVCDTHYEAINWGWGEIMWFGRADGDRAAAMKATIARQTRDVQAWLTAKLGKHEYFGGQYGFGWADVCAAPFVMRSRHNGVGPAVGEDSPLGRWLDRVSQRPAVRTTFDEFEEGIANVQKLGAIFKSGERRREYRDHRLEWMIKSGGLDIVAEGLEKNNIRFTWP